MEIAPARAAVPVLAVLSAAAVLVAGYYVSGKVERQSQARIRDLEAGGTVDEPAPVGSMAQRLHYDPARFAEKLAADAAAFGVGEIKLTELAEPQEHIVLVAEPRTIGPRKRWTSHGIEVRASIEKVKYREHGATIAARHSILTLTNRRDTPVAYRLVATAEGRCSVRGARTHNAMALRAGESAEVVVCAGTSRPTIHALEILGLSELGYAYVSQVPPMAVGADPITARAHRSALRVRACELDTTLYAGWIADGKMRWVDLVDYFSRHDCHAFVPFVDYRHATEPMDRLPARPPQ